MSTPNELLSRAVQIGDDVARKRTADVRVVRSQEFKEFLRLQEALFRLGLRNRQEITEVHIQELADAAKKVVDWQP